MTILQTQTNGNVEASSNDVCQLADIAEEDTTVARKRELSSVVDNDDSAPKKLKVEDTVGSSTPSVVEPINQELIKEQIEYYFSDDNLKTDQFFHSKIASDPEGWLEIKYILSCKKIQKMGVVEKDIMTALETSNLETKVDSNNVGWIRRLASLPELDVEAIQKRNAKHKKDARKNEENTKFSRSAPRHEKDIHNFGCFLMVTNIPEEASWVPVKQAILAVLPEGEKIRYVSPVTSEGTAYVYCRKFENDFEFFKNCTSIMVNGVSVIISLVNDLKVVSMIIDRYLPKNILKDREREVSKHKANANTKSLMMGGTKFDSIEHLRKCYRELLELAVPDVPLKPVAHEVVGAIRAVLNYHPRAEEKTKDLDYIKVSYRTDLEAKNDNKPVKCFFVVKKNGECEDFSMVKCIDNLLKNPSLLQQASGEEINNDVTGKEVTSSDKEVNNGVSGAETRASASVDNETVNVSSLEKVEEKPELVKASNQSINQSDTVMN